MSLVKRLGVILVVALLQGCGGGGDSKRVVVDSCQDMMGTACPGPSLSSASSVLASSSLSIQSSLTSSSLPSQSSSISSSSSASSTPAFFPTGTAETLPVLNLTTENAAPVVSKEDYLNGSFTLTGTDTPDTSGTLQIRGRGNSTWAWPKKPYRLKLTNSTSLLGMPAGKNWVLLANYADKTLMRNDIAFMFSTSLGMEYTVKNQYVEVQMNGVYQGVYQLVEHIRVDKNRVAIPELKVTDIDVDKVTGGYLIEVDFRHDKNWCQQSPYESFCQNGENTLLRTDFCVESNHGMAPFCLDAPDTLLDPAWSKQKQYIETYLTDTETALFGSNFADPATGYSAYIDVDSAINYYLVNELLKNVDGAVSSFYMYKKRNGKLFFGPVWDFDLSMGNAGYYDVDKTYGWRIRQASWFDRLFQDPAFVAKVKTRWAQLKTEGKLEQILQYAEARAVWLDKQQQKNYALWSVTDFDSWIKHVPMGNYDLEVKEMIRWQRERIQWMDAQLSL